MVERNSTQTPYDLDRAISELDRVKALILGAQSVNELYRSSEQPQEVAYADTMLEDAKEQIGEIIGQLSEMASNKN
jgi:hypothetical protein